MCANARDTLDEAVALRRHGYLGRALVLFESTDRRCSTAPSRRGLMEVRAALGQNELAREVQRRRIALGDIESGDAIPMVGLSSPSVLVRKGLANRKAGREVEARSNYSRALATAEAVARKRASPERVSSLASATAVALHPSGHYLAAADRKSEVALWDRRIGPSGRVVRLFNHRAVRALLFSPAGDRLITAGPSRGGFVVRVFSVATGARMVERKMRRAVSCLAMSDDAGSIAVCQGDQVVVLDAQLTGHERAFAAAGSVASVAISPRGESVALGSGRNLQLFDTRSGRQVWRQNAHSARITQLRFDRRGDRLASGDSDGSVSVLDAATGAEVFAYGMNRSPVVGLAFGRTHFVSLCENGVVRLWPREPRGEHAVLKLGATHALALAATGDVAVSVERQGLALWRATTGERVQRLRSPVAAINSVAISARARFIAAASADGTVKLWDLRRGRFLQLEGHRGPVLSVGFSTSGRWLASGGTDGTIHVWEMRTARHYAVFGDLAGDAVAVAFSRDGKRVGARLRTVAGISSSWWDIYRSGQVSGESDAHWSGVQRAAAAAGIRATVADGGGVSVVRGGASAVLLATRSGAWLVVAGDGRVDGSDEAQSLILWNVGRIQLPGFIGWQRQQTAGLLAELFATSD